MHTQFSIFQGDNQPCSSYIQRFWTGTSRGKKWHFPDQRSGSAPRPLDRTIMTTTTTKVHRDGPPPAAAVGQLVGTPPVSTGKQIEKVATWRDRVAEETAVERALAASEAYRDTVLREAAAAGGASATYNTSREFASRGRNISRDPSLASGQSYRSAGARTSLQVHPSESVRERLTGSTDWAEESRAVGRGPSRIAPGRSEVEMNGDIAGRMRNDYGKTWK